MIKLDSSWKMIKMCLSLLFIFVAINRQVEAKNSCNDECLTKTYCVSSNGSGVCSYNNLVTAQFKAILVFGEYDYLQLTLKGYNVAPEDEKTIRLNFDGSRRWPGLYTCQKSSLGSTYARFDRNTYSKLTGSSSYSDGVLSCTWTFNIEDDLWPRDNRFIVDLLKYRHQSITIYYDSKEVIVAQDTSQLPIYHAQYLKCCNKVHGNDDFLITFQQKEKQILYKLYCWKHRGTELTVMLTRKDKIKLQFDCNLYSKVLKGYIINGAEQISVNKQVSEATVINSEICSWATPFVLGDSRISIDASNSVFDLQVNVYGFTVYTEKGVIIYNITLKNSSHLAKLSCTLIAFVVLLQISFLRL